MERQKRVAEWYHSFKKALRCEICGESDWRCLDFHHTNPHVKFKNVSVMVYKWPLKRVWKEIEKCRVLCANCHRKLTLEA